MGGPEGVEDRPLGRRPVLAAGSLGIGTLLLPAAAAHASVTEPASTSGPTLVAWGAAGGYRLGDGTTSDATRPVSLSAALADTGGVSSLRTVTPVRVSTLGAVGVAVGSDGSLHAWGTAAYGEFLGATDAETLTFPTRIDTRAAGLTGAFTDAVVVLGGVLAIADGRLYGWGRFVPGGFGTNVLGFGDATETVRRTPTVVAAGSVLGITPTRLGTTTTGFSVFVVDSTGALHGSGINNSQQLGLGVTGNSDVFREITAATTALQGASIAAAASGGDAGVILRDGGTAFGVGSWGNASSPFQAPTDLHAIAGSSLDGRTVVSVHGLANGGVALDSGGKVHGWGNRARGQLADGYSSSTYSAVSVPFSISDITDHGGVPNPLLGRTIVALATTTGSVAALDATGRVFTWGRAANGRLGNGTTSPDVGRPLDISASGALDGVTVAALSSGDGAVFARAAAPG